MLEALEETKVSYCHQIAVVGTSVQPHDLVLTPVGEGGGFWITKYGVVCVSAFAVLISI